MSFSQEAPQSPGNQSSQGNELVEFKATIDMQEEHGTAHDTNILIMSCTSPEDGDKSMRDLAGLLGSMREKKSKQNLD